MTRFSFFAYKGDHCDCNECRAYREGRLAIMRLVYIGSACAKEIDCMIVARHTARLGELAGDTFACAGIEYMRDKRVGRALANAATAEAALDALAALGDETAIGLLAERS